ncbi:MAG: adenylosuccinate lyase, partial [Fusobacterium sp.]|nr:adenylosuccinate lyase [Fusobacterium sp.]
MSRDIYSNPLCERYSSKEMMYNFSPDKKFSTWRKLWLALAEAEKELGLNITDEQIEEMKENIFNIDYDLASQKEKEFRHDVMAHVHTFGTQAPKAMPIIHLGATSAFVGDNTDLIQIKDALKIIKVKIVNIMNDLANFSLENKSVATLGFTHFQAAQLTTVGKRATLWLQSLMLDLEEIEFRENTLRFRGVKGTTGTQASFRDLFNGDYSKVEELDEIVSKKMGFNKKFGVTGQTYDRKVDSEIMNLLSNIAQSAHKFTNDLRLLQHLKEIEEP